jgi:Fungal Zn(2)-Cys(6) binuclear cluster domain
LFCRNIRIPQHAGWAVKQRIHQFPRSRLEIRRIVGYYVMELNQLRGEISPASVGALKPKKQRRISRACDFCHRRSIRCRPAKEDGNRCQNCSDFGADCTFDRPFKRRGTGVRSRPQPPPQPPPKDSLSVHTGSLSHSVTPQTDRCEQPYDTPHEFGKTTTELNFSFDLSEDHQALVLSNIAKIQDLVTVYFEVVYPM